MAQHPVAVAIKNADTAIVQEDFDTLINIYSDDAVLVVKPGLNASGKFKFEKHLKPLRRTLITHYKFTKPG